MSGYKCRSAKQSGGGRVCVCVFVDGVVVVAAARGQTKTHPCVVRQQFGSVTGTREPSDLSPRTADIHAQRSWLTASTDGLFSSLIHTLIFNFFWFIIYKIPKCPWFFLLLSYEQPKSVQFIMMWNRVSKYLMNYKTGVVFCSSTSQLTFSALVS